MTLEELKRSVSENYPPETISNLLEVLWYDAKGDWEKAHKIIQDISGRDAAWIHAYLHRKEGDNGNASYWYSKSERSFSNKTLDEEWEEIASYLLQLE
jgi:hypothetical protein